MEAVTRLALLVALVSGCFYADPINQRPSVAIEVDNDDPVRRGETRFVTAVSDDPDGHYVKYRWRAYACTDATDPAQCDDVPFDDGLNQVLTFDVPVDRADGVTPVESLRIVLGATDELGATARPEPELVVPVFNAPPTLALSKDHRERYTIARPVRVFARVGDLDDGPDRIGPLVWKVYAPTQGAVHTLTELAVVEDPPDPVFDHFGKTFVAADPGEWMIEVSATDPLGDTTTELLAITVSENDAPCLAQLQPTVPSAGAALPLTDPTLFRVPVVIDDLDVYPPQPSDPILGVTRFEWLLRRDGAATFTRITGATGNSVALDPASFTPGDLVELRVQIYDRSNTVVNCPVDDATCSTISQPSCIQRQTWRVEVR